MDKEELLKIIKVLEVKIQRAKNLADYFMERDKEEFALTYLHDLDSYRYALDLIMNEEKRAKEYDWYLNGGEDKYWEEKK